MISSLFLLGIRWRTLTLVFVLAMTLVTGFGLPYLRIDTSFNSLIPSDEPERLVYQRVMDEFGSDNKTIIYIADENLWSSEKLTYLESLVNRLKQLNAVTRVDSVFSLRTIEGRQQNEDGESVINTRPVLEGIPKSALEAEQARTRALDNPLYLGNLFSQDGSVTAIVVTVSDRSDAQDFSSEIYESLERSIEGHRTHFDRIFQVGPPRINAELRSSLADDFRLLGPLSAIVLVVSILFFMRSSLAALIPLLTSCLAIVWTFGVMGWTGVPLNILSAMIPSLIIVIGSTEDTHMISAYFRGLAESPSDSNFGIDYMAKHTGLPMLLTILTTALGFASNLFGDILLIYHFAIASTLAILFNGIVTVLVVPPLLVRFGSKQAQNEKPGRSMPEHIIRTFRISQDKFPIYTLVVTFLLCSFFTYQASNLYVTNDPLSYFPDDRPLIQETRQIHEDLAGIKVFFVALESDKDKAFLEPENLRRLSEIQTFMDQQGVFDTSVSIADHLKYVNREFQGGVASLPPTRQLVAQFLLFFHRSELENYVSHDYRRANIVVRHNLSDSHTLNLYIQELKDAVAQIAGKDIKAMVVGENLLVNNAAERLMISQVKALTLLLALIFIIMSIMFTSFRGGAIAMIPSVIPIVLMFGIMGLLGIPLNPGTAMVAVIAVGIAVDGTIHLLARYNEQCRMTSDYEGAVHKAVQEVATPLIVSSLALSLGFGILLFSNFTVVAQFGALAATTMLISIFANLLITPIIMARIRLVGLYQIIAMKVDQSVLERSPLFSDMTNYQRRKAILISEVHTFEAGEKLVHQGDVGRNMYMILDGEAEVVRVDGDSSRILATLSPGEIFGEVGYIQEIERTADVVATSAVTALNFEYTRMQKDLKYFPHIVAKLNFNISNILGKRLADVLESQATR
jgi:uncharacterized protein